MSASEYSFIDIAVLDDVRGRFAAGDALAILSSDLEEVIWANGPGARLFGYPDIEAIMGASAGLAFAQRRQIAATPGYPAIGSGRPLVLRLNAGATSRAIAFEASAVVLPDGEQAILLASPAAAAGARDPGEIARRAISGFTEAGYYAAFVRGSTVAAAAPGYEALGVSAETVERLVAEAADAPDRLVKRLIPAASGRIPAGMARLSDAPPIHLLVVVDDPELYRAEDFPDEAEEAAALGEAAEEDASAASEAPEALRDAIPDEAVTPETAGSEPEAETEDVAPAAEAAGTVPSAGAEERGPVDHWYFESDVPSERVFGGGEKDATVPSPAAEPTDEAGRPDDDATARKDAADAMMGASAEAGEPDTRTTAKAEAGNAARPHAPVAPSIHEPPPFTRSDPPVRFAWRTDAEGRFSTISADFLRVVAATEDDIAGREFADVAAALDIDPAGDIAGLLDRRDTWSGKTVLWPIGDSGWRTPVDLAALPVYARDRRFEGFRGFGIARPADAVFMPLPRREAVPADAASTSDPIEESADDLSPDAFWAPDLDFGAEDEALPASAGPDVGFDVPDEAPDADERAASPAGGERPAARETPIIAIDEARARRYPDKIIRLAEHRGSTPERALSPGERNAFREIGDRLKQVTEPRETDGAAPEVRTEATGGGDSPNGVPAQDHDAGIVDGRTAPPETETTGADAGDEWTRPEAGTSELDPDASGADAIDWTSAATPSAGAGSDAERDEQESEESHAEGEHAAPVEDEDPAPIAFIEVEEELTALPDAAAADETPPAEASGADDWALARDDAEGEPELSHDTRDRTGETADTAAPVEDARDNVAASTPAARTSGPAPARRAGDVLAGQAFVDRSALAADTEEAPEGADDRREVDIGRTDGPDAMAETVAAEDQPATEEVPADDTEAPWEDAAAGEERLDDASPAAETVIGDEPAENAREEAPAMAEQPRFALGSAEQPVSPMIDDMIAAEAVVDVAADASGGAQEELGGAEADAIEPEDQERPAEAVEAIADGEAEETAEAGFDAFEPKDEEPSAATIADGEPEAGADVVRLPFAVAGAAQTDGDGGVGRGVLARLPLPVLVHAGDLLHFANDAFFAFTGYRSLEELEEAGGLGALFVDPQTETDEDERPSHVACLRLSDDTTLPVHAHLQSIPWGRGKALLLALRPAEAPRDEAPTSAGDADNVLAARVEEMRTILDTATDGVVLIANDGTIRSLNRPAEALFGQDDAEVAGKPFASLLAVESQRAARDYLQGLSDNGVASVLNDGREVIGREAQGRFIPLFMTIGRLPGGNGYCAVLRDITPWKRAEEELTKARTIAERASSQKSEFLARVSHEIRTPLNAIIGFSELMMDEKFGPIGNDRYRDYLRDINRSGNHVLDLVNDLLDISKIEAGEQEMAYEAVSLNDVLGETVAMMQPQANRERVIIRSSFASRLPDVVADLRSIRQIGLNLLSNAVRFTQPGGQVIVSTAYEASGDVVMRVRDTGVGMSSAEIEQALKPFKQINTLRRPRMDGTGLGLPLTKAMVEANRARFVIHSSPGEGTLVEIAFPSTRVLAD